MVWLAIICLTAGICLGFILRVIPFVTLMVLAMIAAALTQGGIEAVVVSACLQIGYAVGVAGRVLAGPFSGKGRSCTARFRPGASALRNLPN